MALSKGGAETIIHACRSRLEAGELLATIDATNAFTAVLRSAIREVLEAEPALRPLIPMWNLLYFGEVQVENGGKRGDGMFVKWAGVVDDLLYPPADNALTIVEARRITLQQPQNRTESDSLPGAIRRNTRWGRHLD